MYQNQAHRGTDEQVMRWVEKQVVSSGFLKREEKDNKGCVKIFSGELVIPDCVTSGSL